MWYCAHAIFYLKTESQGSVLVHENVYLVRSDDPESALADAIRIARGNEDLNDDGHLELNGAKAQYRFAGIRKLIEVETSPETAAGKLPSGSEVTYSVFEVDSLAEVELLASGEMTDVLYRE
jgi:hypothetical protein